MSTHDEIFEQIGAFVDNELSSEEGVTLQAHIAQCQDCEAELQLQRSVKESLRQVSLAPDSDFSATQAMARFTKSLSTSSDRPKGWFFSRPQTALLSSGWLVAMTILAWSVIGSSPGDSQQEKLAIVASAQVSPPMIREVLGDFQHLLQTQLPLTNTNITDGHFLASSATQILSSWPTSVQSLPATAVAYRYADQIIVQYNIPVSLLNRQAAVRQAISLTGLYTQAAGTTSVVAWRGAEAGHLLVGKLSGQTLGRLARNL